MPLPAYIICSDLRSEDKKTNRLSLFNILEKVIVSTVTPIGGSPAPSGQPVYIAFDAVLTSVWLLSDADKGCEFENKVYFRDQDGVESFELALPPMKIGSDSHAYFHRVQVDFFALPPLPHSGIWWMVNSIRLLGGEGEWVTQAFPFTFEANDMFFVATKGASVQPVVTTESSTVGLADKT